LTLFGQLRGPVPEAWTPPRLGPVIRVSALPKVPSLRSDGRIRPSQDSLPRRLNSRTSQQAQTSPLIGVPVVAVVHRQRRCSKAGFKPPKAHEGPHWRVDSSSTSPSAHTAGRRISSTAREPSSIASSNHREARISPKVGPLLQASMTETAGAVRQRPLFTE
jgi:hypothetical protein